MTPIWHDPVFFYALAFFIFLALAYRYAKKPTLHWLDSEIKKIRDELEQARTLRLEAEVALNQFKTKQMEAITQAEAIVQHAKDEAAQLKAEAEAELKASLARHEQQALDRIRLLEIEAIESVRKSAIDLAITTAKNVFSSQLDDSAASRLIDQAISDIPDSKAHKAKAA